MKKKILGIILTGILTLNVAMPISIHAQDLKENSITEVNSDDVILKNMVTDVTDINNEKLLEQSDKIMPRSVVRTYNINLESGSSQLITTGIELGPGQIKFSGLWSPPDGSLQIFVQQKINGSYVGISIIPTYVWNNRSSYMNISEYGTYRFVAIASNNVNGTLQMEIK